MKCSEVTILEAIENVDVFCPTKIFYDDIVLYNDYDSEEEIEKGIYGEIMPPLAVIPERIKHLGYEKKIVSSIKIEIVEFHHSIIYLKSEQGE